MTNHIPNFQNSLEMIVWLRAQNQTYGKLADRLGINAGLLWKVMNKDHVPANNNIRKKLGLPPQVNIIPIMEVKPGTQVYKSVECQCGNYFSYAGNRKYCYICSPPNA
jgi:hypothetical protein